MTSFELSEVIDNAILNEEVVRFYYLRDGVPMQRTLSPYEASEDGLSILGFDHGRQALRRFDCAKIMDIETVDEEYVRPVERN